MRWWERPGADVDDSHSFAVNRETYDLLVKLGPVFGETTAAGALRKACALAMVVAKHAGASNFVTLAGDDGATPDGKPIPPITIHLNG